MIRLRFLLLCCCTFLFCQGLPLFALEIPDRPEGHLSDYAGIISPPAAERLEEKLRRYEEETSNQVVVATFPSLEEESLEDFSIRLAEKWKIGQEGKDNGVLLLIFKEERAVRIEVGYGLEGALTDATAKLIIENEIVPLFRQGKFDQGIAGATEAILAATRGEYRSARSSSFAQRDWGSAFVLGIFLGAFLPFFLLQLLFWGGITGILWALLAGPAGLALVALLVGVWPFIFYFLSGRHGRGDLTFGPRGYSWGGNQWGGGWGGGSGGGGFSGGGGSFGGGGASGRW